MFKKQEPLKSRMSRYKAPWTDFILYKTICSFKKEYLKYKYCACNGIFKFLFTFRVLLNYINFKI